MLSIIVATMNRSYCLKTNLLHSILEQEPYQFGSCELIIVDSSQDKQTEIILEELSDKFNRKGIELRYFVSEAGTVTQRAKGFENAKGDLIAFFDDDVFLDKNVIEVVFELFNNKGIVGLGLSIIQFDKQKSLPVIRKLKDIYNVLFFIQPIIKKRCITLSGNNCFNHNNDTEGSVSWLTGCSMVFKKEVFNENTFPFELERFSRYALCEDLYISLECSQSGELWVTEKAKVLHNCYQGARIEESTMITALIYNRFIVLEKFLFKKKTLMKLAYIWSMIGILFKITITAVLKRNTSIIKGYFKGVSEIIKYHNKY